MGSGYTFDDQDDEGIFADDYHAAAGDPDAEKDLRMESWVPGLSLSIDKDGLVEFPPEMDGRNILEPPERVDVEKVLCLGGPCRHYTEVARLIPEGPQMDAEGNVEVGRWCGKIRTWAEQTDLTEANIHGCTAYEPVNYGPQEIVNRAMSKNLDTLKKVRDQEIEEKVVLGICAIGPCEDFVEMVVETPTEPEWRSRRWCQRLAGAARFFDLSEKPVISCSGWRPLGNNPSLAAVAAANIQYIERCRKSMAERPEEEDDES